MTETLPIKRLASVTLGKMIQPESKLLADISAPYLRAAHLQPHGRIIDLPDQRMWFSRSELRTLRLQRGDVVIVEGGAGYGRSAVIREEMPGWGFQNSIVRLRPAVARSEGRYLDYALQGALSDGRIELVTSTATLPHFTADKVSKFEVWAPPLDEQRAIADYLDQETAQIDALVAKQEEFIRLLSERRRMAIDRTLSSADDDSPRVRLKYMLLRVEQGVSPQAENGLVEGDEWGVLKTGCVNGGSFREREHKRLPGDFTVDRKLAVRAGDLIVSRANGTPSYVGSAALVEQIDRNLILSDKLFRLVLRSDVDAQFLAWSMNSRAYRTQVEASISGAAGLANNLPLSDLRSFEFSLPEFSAQKRIVENINEQTNAIDTLITKAEEHIGLAKERRAALITAAVTGQFDVRTARKAG